MQGVIDIDRCPCPQGFVAAVRASAKQMGLIVKDGLNFALTAPMMLLLARTAKVLTRFSGLSRRTPNPCGSEQSMSYRFDELIDLVAVQKLMESLWQTTGIPVGILDLEGAVLVATGWQRICTEFHRQHPELAARCRQSDQTIHARLQQPAALAEWDFVEYTCPNGLVDAALPILIEGRHLATLFIGQYFYAPPDPECFRAQARQFGLDEADYLEALAVVPVFSREKVAGMLDFHRSLVNLLTLMGVQNLQMRRQQRRLTLSEERFRSIFATTPLGMSLVDLEGKILDINQAACDFVGYHVEELLGTHFLNLADPADWEAELGEMGRLDRGEIASFHMEKRYRHRNGETCWGLLNVALLRNESGRPICFIKQVIDSTERKSQEEALRLSEQKYRRLYEQFRVLFEGISDPLLLLAPDLRIDWANPMAVATFGAPGSELVGSYCYEAFQNRLTACDPCSMQDCFQSGTSQEYQMTTVGDDLWNIRGFPIADQAGRAHQVLLYCQEVGSKMQAHAEALRASQLASLGELAAGVAHEINNPLNGVINYAQMLRNRFADDPKAREVTERLLKEGSRIAAIVGSLLAFARPHKEAKRPVVLAEVLQDCLTLAGVQLHKQGIVLQLDLPVDLPQVVAMPQQLQQVFLNLISNARYALCEKYPDNHADKILEISGEALDLQDGLWVRLTFQDYGTGIPEAIRDKVLNPFFTTKPPDRGTGLGLSISHGIIKAHGGKLQLSSVPGVFTVVTIDLPAEPKPGSKHAS